MRPHRLKRLRVVVALLFAALTALLFLDFREVGTVAMADAVLFLQFVPSLLTFLESAGLAAAGFVVVLLFTALFGRVYCSTVCPLGTLQDAVGRMAGKAGRKHAFTKPHNRLRHAVLVLTAGIFLGGSGLALNLLDPFSSFGRMLSNLARPLLLAANNLIAPAAEMLGFHGVYRVAWPALAPASIAVAATTLLAVVWIAARRGRLYCNTVCPVGTLLGLVSRVAPYRIRIDSRACRKCGLCERVCKAECMDFETATVDASRCVACCNCLAACPEGAVRMTTRRPAYGSGDEDDPGRRRLLIWLAAGGLGLGATTAEAALPPDFKPSRPTAIPENRTSPVSPPGSGSIAHFTSRCTACHLCVSACPSRVLAPSFLEYGPSGAMQPRLDFADAHCNYDCTICSNICPSGAIAPQTTESKQRIQMGVARFIKENCVVFTDNTNCGACSEHCPTKAVHMVPYPNTAGRKLVIPEVSAAICVGCGACEHACPTRPYRAICVDGNPVHKTAEKPVVKELEHTPPLEGDFPF